MSDYDSSTNSSLRKPYDGTNSTSIADGMRPALDSLKGGVHQAVDRMADVTTQTVNKLEKSGEYLKDSQERMLGSCRTYVQANPLTTVGMAVAGGLLLGMIYRKL